MMLDMLSYQQEEDSNSGEQEHSHFLLPIYVTTNKK